jgi:chromosome segregation ATPase
MSEPIIDLGIGFLFAALLAFGMVAAMRARASRSAVLRLQSMPPPVMTAIEADMDQVHSQIAVATRRLEICVEQMKSKTTNQLAEIGKTSETIGRLKAELTERNAQLAALQEKERTVGSQLHTTVAELAAKMSSLEDTEHQLADRKAALAKLISESDIHPELAKAEARHAAEIESLRAEKAALEEQLAQSRTDYAKLQDYVDSMKKQVETTWASERMANAVLRERINDVASEVVRVAVALEGLHSPMDSLVAGKATAAETRAEGLLAAGENGEIALPSPVENGNGNGQSSELIHRIRALRQRSVRATTPEQ